MTEKFETAANHTVECCHLYLIARILRVGLLKVFFLQVGNFTREIRTSTYLYM